MKKYQVVHFINHVRKDYVTKESVQLKTAIKHTKEFYLNGYGFLNLATALVENHADETQRELITMSFVQNNDYSEGEAGFLHIFENFIAYYIDMLRDTNKERIQIPTSFNKTYAIKPSQCEEYKEALMRFVKVVIESQCEEKIEKLMGFEIEKMKDFDYYYKVKKKNTYKFGQCLVEFAKDHPQIQFGNVLFEFKLTSKNTALMNLYFGEKGKELMGQL